jgi:hypothetical protein
MRAAEYARVFGDTPGRSSAVRFNPAQTSVYQPSSVLLPRNPIEFVYPHGFVLRRVNNSGDISWHKGRVFVSEVFRLTFSASNRSMKTSTRSIVGMLRLASLTRKRLASGRFRSCDEWMFGVNFRQARFYGNRSGARFPTNEITSA